MSGGRAEREGDTESKAGSRFRALSTEPNTRLEPLNREILTRAKVGRLTGGATYAPLSILLMHVQNCFRKLNVGKKVVGFYLVA